MQPIALTAQLLVMAGRVPAIHEHNDVDARHRAGHDGEDNCCVYLSDANE